MKKLCIVLDTAWVLGKRGSSTLPAASLAAYLKEKGEHARAMSFTRVEVTLPDNGQAYDTLCEVVVSYIAKAYSMVEREVADVLSFSLEDAEDTTPKAVPAPAETPEPAPGNQAPVSIPQLLGAEELQSLCSQIQNMAPLLQARNLGHILTGRSYLFSIDDGCGLTTSLELLQKLFRETGLFKLEGSPVEMKLPITTSGQSDPLASATRDLSGARHKLICLDISLWMDKVTSPEFRDFFTALSRLREHIIVVFRVPFLEKDALNRIGAAISDVLLLDTVTFPPLSPDQISLLACQWLGEYGFDAPPEVWDLFRQRLAEEKSDGRFYGAKTARKVVDEMVFLKFQRVLEGAVESTRIEVSDLDGFVRDVNSDISYAQRLERMVGVDAIRTRLEEIVGQIEFARRNTGVQAPSMHMRFIGNPGTGKTTVARILGQMLKERGILSKGHFFEHSGGDFIGMYVGHTAPKTLALCRDAYGSVLFIDEAYTLSDASYSNGDGYAKEAIDTLIAQMENHRDDMVVIMAGYPREMVELMALNPGLAGRMPYELVFPNYGPGDLGEIFVRMMSGDGFTCEAETEAAIRDYFLNLGPEVLQSKDFSNARFVRNLFERTWSKTITRAQLDGTDPKHILLADFRSATNEDTRTINVKQARHPRPGFRLGLA